MKKQPELRFEEVPITDTAQERYHAIAPCLAGKSSLQEQAEALNISYSTVRKWLEKFRKEGIAGLVDKTPNRPPNTPESLIVLLVFFKCCVPKVSDRELARAISNITGHQFNHKTVGALLERFFLWKYPQFSDQIKYAIPNDYQLRRLEMVKLQQQGWSEKTIATLLNCNRHTVNKWLRRYKVEIAQKQDPQLCLFDRSHAPQNPRRKVYFGTIRAVLELQKKYGYAGWFRIHSF